MTMAKVSVGDQSEGAAELPVMLESILWIQPLCMKETRGCGGERGKK